MFDLIYNRFDGVTWHVQSVPKGVYDGAWESPDAEAVSTVVTGQLEGKWLVR